MEIVIHDSGLELARMAADVIEDAVRNTENPVLGLATGSSPLPIYKELIRRHKEEGLSFANCTAFTLDEYVGLPQGHKESYYEVIRNEFTRHVDIDDSRVFSPDGSSENLQTAGARYDEAIKNAGGVDVQILGIGSDGHVAFNEPGSSLSSRTRLKTLTQQTREDNARFFDSIDDVPMHALTQGLGTILEARHLVLIATGEGKAKAVADMVEGPLAAVCPGSVLQLHNRATVFVDEAAASGLEHSEYYRLSFDRKPEWQKF
ncbi:glucosamine-6-phosphate deaminase [Timonella senegalensis]|uniref:glucosamine-6-phosphate deaminase n=2 Tax=Timonella senegalensis TaxID=1465825 RepID=UPI00030A42A4|nr:glucosamine-6-phosphate deaminase [Timonella senegalensis]